MNGLRGVAAVAVVLFHAHHFFPDAIAPSGYLAVDLFFILSGFVIAFAYDPRFEQGLRPLHFFTARFKRFWPLFMLGIIAGAAWFTLETIISPPAILSPFEIAGSTFAAFLFLPFPNGGDLFPLNVPAWSLFLELLINAGFAIFHKRLTNRVLIVICICLAPAIITLALSGNFALQSFGILRAAFGFSLGVLLFRNRVKLPNWPIPPSLGILCICAPLLLNSSPILEILCVFMLFPIGIALLANPEPSRLDGVYGLLGALSFPLYALHYPILNAALGISSRLPIPIWITGIAAILMCFIVAVAAEYWFDKPLRNWLKKRAQTSTA